MGFEDSLVNNLSLSLFFYMVWQDGRIDYGEFATMMKKGNTGLAARTMRGNLNFNLADALGASDSVKDQ